MSVPAPCRAMDCAADVSIVPEGSPPVLTIRRRVSRIGPALRARRHVLAAMAALSVFAVLSFPFVQAEFGSDEGDNLVGGQLVAQGRVVYRDFFSQHTPFGYLYSAAFQLVLGRNWALMRHSVALLGLANLAYLAWRLRRDADRTLFYAVALFAALWPFYSVIYWGYMLLNDNLPRLMPI